MELGYFVTLLGIITTSVILSNISGYSRGMKDAEDAISNMILAAEKEGIITRSQIIQMRKMQIDRKDK
jgi:hypothetical protein